MCANISEYFVVVTAYKDELGLDHCVGSYSMQNPEKDAWIKRLKKEGVIRK
jgi:hypothetical protein